MISLHLYIFAPIIYFTELIIHTFNTIPLTPSTVIVLILYAYRLPEFRPAQLLQALAVFIPMTIYFPLLWVKTRRTQIALATAGLVADIVRIDLLAWNLKARWDARKGEKVDVKWWSMPRLKKGIRIPGECRIEGEKGEAWGGRKEGVWKGLLASEGREGVAAGDVGIPEVGVWPLCASCGGQKGAGTVMARARRVSQFSFVKGWMIFRNGARNGARKNPGSITEMRRKRRTGERMIRASA